MGSDFFQAPEVDSKTVYGPECDHSIGKTLLVCRFGYWTDNSLRDKSEAGRPNDWHNYWGLEHVYQLSDSFVEEILRLTNENPKLRPSVETALETFWNLSNPTDQQSRDFLHAAGKLLKFKGLGLLRHKCNLKHLAESDVHRPSPIG